MHTAVQLLQCQYYAQVVFCMGAGQAIPDCVNVIFKRANHWLYLEHPDVFNRIVLDFAHHGNVGKPKLLEYP